jgi:hypothetical protein
MNVQVSAARIIGQAIAEVLRPAESISPSEWPAATRESQSTAGEIFGVPETMIGTEREQRRYHRH